MRNIIFIFEINLNKLNGTEWVIEANDAKIQIQESINSLQDVYNKLMSSIQKK